MLADVPLEGATRCHDIGVLLTKRRSSRCARAWTRSSSTSPTRPSRCACARSRRRASTIWHSAALSWDGKVAVMGWEPGAGEAPACEASDPDVLKSIFFFSTETGDLLGTWVLPRAQSAVENCTIHNYTIVPDEEARRPDHRRLPGRDVGRRLHEPGPGEDHRLGGPAAARSERVHAGRIVGQLLVQRTSSTRRTSPRASRSTRSGIAPSRAPRSSTASIRRRRSGLTTGAGETRLGLVAGRA